MNRTARILLDVALLPIGMFAADVWPLAGPYRNSFVIHNPHVA
ncbi:MAG TPA: hypothetical protein VMS17_30150 [Gemmataceae bacterium]|nr:hypothetical protein [Gemmataceae bacterium]